MLSFFLRLGENRIEQLNRQEQIDIEISKMPCFETTRNLFLFEREMQVQMGRKMYENLNPLDIYTASKSNMEWIDDHHKNLEKIVKNPNKLIACSELAEYLKKMKNLKIET
jgi:hypothetical protein